jgi:RNA polymerase sigma factor (sigma-70 family)
MATGLPELLTRLRAAVRADRPASDADLLAAFARDRDEAAFAELVRRHGPVVLAECRRGRLFDPSAADDVFQATFLVLSRRAGAIHDPGRLGGWLRGVTRRIARRYRRQAARRAATERPLDPSVEPAVDPVTPVLDLRDVLAEELGRLPARYREVVAACDVDGLSRRAAAERLGIPDGTLSNRLTRARALLARRLVRRGVTPGVGVAVLAGTADAVSSRRVSLALSLVRSGPVPARVAFLATEVSTAMILFRAFLVGVVAVGGSAIGFAAFSRPAVVPAPQVPAARAVPAEPPDPEPSRGYYIYAAGYSRDGTRLALAQPKTFEGEGEHKVLVFDTRTWKQVHKLTGLTDYCFALAFSADGKTLYAGCRDGKVYTWDAKTGTPGPTIDAKAGSCDSVTFSPDGKMLATGHCDFVKQPRANAIHLRDAATLQSVRVIRADDAVLTPLTFTPDGTSLAAGFNNERTGEKDFSGVVEWDVATGKEVRRYDAVRITPGARPVVEQVAYTPDGKWVVVGGGEAVPTPDGTGSVMYGYLWVYDRATGKVEKTLVDRRSHYVRKLALSTKGDKLFVATTSLQRGVVENGQLVQKVFGELQCWDTKVWELDWVREDKETSRNDLGLIVSPDGRRVGGSSSGGFYLFDAATGERKGGLFKTKFE